jgi:TRAP-type mannitol/chloroaromatic compound transport system permease small subunit
VAGGHLQKEGAFPMKKLTQLMSLDDAAVGYIILMQMLHLKISDLFVICALQAVLGCTLVANIDMPWSLLGFILLLASTYTLKTIPAISEALEDGGETSE